MAITARIGICTSAYNKVDKNTTQVDGSLEKTVEPTGSVSDMNCSFIVNGTNTQTPLWGQIDYHNCNYMSVNWGAGVPTYYYFIEQVISLTATRTQINCKLDVLKTFKSTIYNSDCIINRTSNTEYVNFYLRDDRVPILSTSELYSDPFGDPVCGNQEYYYVGIWASGKIDSATS